MLTIGLLIGPCGVIIGIFALGDEAFSGNSNIKSLDSLYLIDYFTISATYNLAVIIVLALLAWILKSTKVSFSKILNIILLGHLFFIPSFLVSLFLSVIPMEGNIKGFFIFPVFILTAIGGIIVFLIFFLIKISKLKKEDKRILDYKTLIPYGISIVILLFLNSTTNKSTTKDVNLISFEHENFSWGIKRTSKTKYGVVKPSINDPYIIYINHKNRENEASNIKLLKDYHSLYTKFDSIIPVQSMAIKYNALNPDYPLNYNNNFEVVSLNKNKSIYRLRKGNSSYTLLLKSSEANLNAMSIIAKDIIENSSFDRETNALFNGFIVEAVAINEEPFTDEKFSKSDGSYIKISENGEVLFKDISLEDEYYLEELGTIKEGVFYSNDAPFNMDSFVKNNYRPINYTEFKNTKNQTLEEIYTHINGRKTASSIKFAIDNNPKIENLYLTDNNNISNGNLASINKLRKLGHLNTHGIDIGIIPESICELYFLSSINIENSKTLIFPDCISEMRSLIFIDAVNCNLTEVPKAFYKSQSIEGINLKGNKITSLPKELNQNTLLTSFTLDFTSNLEIAKEIINNKSFTLWLVVYNKEDLIKAEDFVKKQGKSSDQIDDKDEDEQQWNVIEGY
jgi:hypothetical protein